MARAEIGHGALVEVAVVLIRVFLGVIVVEVGIAGRGLEPLGQSVIDTDADAPAVDVLQVVACSQFEFPAEGQLLRQFLIERDTGPCAELVALCL